LLLIFAFPFIRIFFRAAQVWLVYTTFIGERVPYREGISRAKQNKADILTMGFFNIVLSAFSRHLKGSGTWFKEILGILRLDDADLANQYLLPASIIREKRVLEVAKELKYIRNNIPGALAGVFGLDFAGDTLGGLLNICFLVSLIGLGVLSAVISSATPFLIGLAIIVIINSVFRLFIEMVKTIYFTLFYMAVALPLHISVTYKQKITRYLLHQKFEAEEMAEASRADRIKQLLPYIAQYNRQGYSESDIVSFMLQYGWQEDIVREALGRLRK